MSCGGGVLAQQPLCVDPTTGALLPSSFCSSSGLQLTQCNTQACTQSFRWVAANDWSPCTEPCGGGITYQTVSCVHAATGAVSKQPNIDCAGLELLDFSVMCNNMPCFSISFQVSGWSACAPSDCGSMRERSVQCFLADRTQGNTTNTVDCGSDIAQGNSNPPVMSELCAQCSFCDVSRCSGHGTCVSTTQSCQCDPGYSGLECGISSDCNGVMSALGSCCDGPGSILDLDGFCCDGLMPTLAQDGTCCPSGILNACGECDGLVTSVIAANGICCSTGVLDADGLCCDGGLDAFGVCAGTSSSGTQLLSVGVWWSQSSLSTPLSDRINLVSAVSSPFSMLYCLTLLLHSL